MEQEVSFETLLKKYRTVVERYINFRMPNSFDADDVISETYCAAYVGYEKLRNKDLFKQWILSIAKNQCNIWYRNHMRHEDISLDTLGDSLEDEALAYDEHTQIVSDILKQIPEELQNDPSMHSC